MHQTPIPNASVPTPPKLVLATANARFSHTSLALRRLTATLDALEIPCTTTTMEFTINERAEDLCERILDQQPDVVGLSVYIWNLQIMTQTTQLIRQVAPQVTIILGGPEVSYPEDAPPIVDDADYVVREEGELIFAQLMAALAKGQKPAPGYHGPVPPDLETIPSPYHLYGNEDIRHRVIYVEASRGCAMGCQFCLSCLSPRVRHFPVVPFVKDLERLFDRGVRQFKFIDRTIHAKPMKPVFEFLLSKKNDGIFVHFEIIPDQVTDRLVEMLAQFPDGAIQLEAGVQSLNPNVLARIGRPQNIEKTLHNLTRLVSDTGVHLHADLVAGLPGEDLASFYAGFDTLHKTGVHEIQLGILKKLRGAPINQHSTTFDMIYRNAPPYDLLQNQDLDFGTMQRLKRFARYYDLYCNSGRFKRTVPLLLKDAPSANFERFADWLFDRTGATANFALTRLGELLFDYLSNASGVYQHQLSQKLADDFIAGGQRRLPLPLRHIFPNGVPPEKTNRTDARPQRQRRHKQ